MRIGVIAYDQPHRKTHDILMMLKAYGYNDVDVYIVGWTYEKKFKPLFEHRPNAITTRRTVEICYQFNYQCFDTSSLSCLMSDIVLVAAGGIIESELLKKKRYINSHPGIIPISRGLDSFKWAIYNGDPIGVTVHEVTDEIDMGPIITQKFVPIYHEDTFHAVAQRVYETEIRLLVESIGEPAFPIEQHDLMLSKEPTRRMPHHKELIMMERFEAIRRKAKSRLDG